MYRLRWGSGRNPQVSAGGLSGESAYRPGGALRSPPDRLLRLAEDLGRVGGKSYQHLLHLLGGGRIDIEPDLVGLGEEVLVLHGRHQGVAQRLQAIGRNGGPS